MSSLSDRVSSRPTLLVPTLAKQCWGFMIGSALFALGSALSIVGSTPAVTSNLCYFIGAWFFTAAGLIQLLSSGAVSVPVSYGSGTMVRAEWLSASTQSLGTFLFNVSTTAALGSKALSAEKHFVWSPDAGGSVAFLVSGVLALVAYAHTARAWDPGDSRWWSSVVNLVGCIAFAFSAVGAYILPDGDAADGSMANVGTFVGAVCFFVASLILLVRKDR